MLSHSWWPKNEGKHYVYKFSLKFWTTLHIKPWDFSLPLRNINYEAEFMVHAKIENVNNQHLSFVEMNNSFAAGFINSFRITRTYVCIHFQESYKLFRAKYFISKSSEPPRNSNFPLTCHELMNVRGQS